MPRPLAPTLLLLTLLYTCDRAQTIDTSEAPRVEIEEQVPYRDLDPVDFADYMGRPNTVVLDVRTPQEIGRGKIDGALEMDFRRPDFQEQLGTLDTTKTYLVYCASGGRSSRTCQMMAERGFDHLYNLRGGYSAWRR